jgi:two-component system sensor histidine kinase BaeS
MKLQFKIFAAFFLAAMILTLFLVLSLRYFMHRHFTEYIYQAELEQLATLQTSLTREYAKTKSWQHIEFNQKWREFIVTALLINDRQNEESPKEEAAQSEQPDTPDDYQTRPRKSTRGFSHFLSRLFLLDARKTPLAGEPGPDQASILQEIRLGHQTVGWLGLRKLETLRTPLEVAFINQQYTLFYLLGSGLLIITGLVSFLLARHLLSPIKKLTAGTQALTSRQFATRIAFRSKDELGRLAADFNVMARNLERYEQMRRQWMTDVAHELRTPLTMLQGDLEAMLDGVRRITPDRLQTLHSDVLRLSKIVKDLHAISLAESGALTYHRESVRPVAVLEETLSHYRHRLEERQIKVTQSLEDTRDIAILGDPDRLSQLFTNLLENNLRYTNTAGRIQIRAWCEEAHWRLRIEDSGPGVPDAAIERLFDRFFRVDPSRSRSLGGSGLGLSISKSIVETMGGEIRAAKAASGGLGIEIIFPLA